MKSWSRLAVLMSAVLIAVAADRASAQAVETPVSAEVVQDSTYRCSRCAQMYPFLFDVDDWRASYTVFLYDECVENPLGEWCVTCAAWPVLEAYCNTDNTDDYDYDAWLTDTEADALAWFDGTAPYDFGSSCYKHLCEEPQLKALADLMAVEDLPGIISLIESSDGKISLNKERGLIQGIGCAGVVSVQYDARSPWLEQLLSKN